MTLLGEILILFRNEDWVSQQRRRIMAPHSAQNRGTRQLVPEPVCWGRTDGRGLMGGERLRRIELAVSVRDCATNCCLQQTDRLCLRPAPACTHKSGALLRRPEACPRTQTRHELQVSRCHDNSFNLSSGPSTPYAWAGKSTDPTSVGSDWSISLSPFPIA